MIQQGRTYKMDAINKKILSIFLVSFFIFTFAFVSRGLGQKADYQQALESGIAGEAFGDPVTQEEFNYYYKTANIFSRTGAKEEGEKEEEKKRSEEEIRTEAWQNLIYRKEARRLGITVSQEKVEEELRRLLSEKGIKYGNNQYHRWLATQLGEETDTFKKRIEDLLIINKLMQEKTNPDVTVTEKEMKQKFLNQYNSFESEYIRFDSEEEARTFLEKVRKNPSLWKETYDRKKDKGQKGASWINIMSLEALIDLWKIPKEDAYKILNSQEGDFITADFYYGTAVFRLLRKKEVSLSEYDEKKKEYYRKRLTVARKRRKIKDYFEDLLKKADYKDYAAERKRAKKIKELKKKSLVVLKTNKGNIKLELFPEAAPKACENFVGLVEKDYYDGLIFHRVVEDFVVQSGDPTGTGTGGESLWGEPFRNEISEDVSFDRAGRLGMANSGPGTNTSQFFITLKPTPKLNKRYTIFGEVVDGFETVEKIAASPADSKNKPLKQQKVIEAYIAKD